MGAFTDREVAEERLKALAESCSALAGQMADLLELRERVRRAQSHKEVTKLPLPKQVGRPGRLFMQNQWMMR
jgi:hypothetical protein